MKYVFAVLVVLSLTSAALAQGRSVTLLKTGDVVPDGNGTFDFVFRMSDLNNQGQLGIVTLIQTPAGTERGTYYYDGTLHTMAREGMLAPGGGTITGLDFVINNENGLMMFFGETRMSGGGADGFSVFLGNGSSTSLVFNEGQGAPNGEAWERFMGFNHDDSGNVYVAATTRSTDGTIRSGLFGFPYGSGGTVVVQSGDAAPDGNGVFADTAHAGTYSALRPASSAERSVGVNGQGSFVFWGDLTNTAGGTADNSGIFRTDGGNLVQVARKGQLSPDGDGTFSDFNSRYAIDINERNSVMFWSFLDNTSSGSASDFGIFLHQDGQLRSVVREGQAAADGNGSYSLFADPQLNENDQILFSAELAGTSGGASDNLGLFRADGDQIVQMARLGDLIPDGTATIADSGRLSPPFRKSQINNHGQVVFLANTSDNVTGASGDAVLVTDGIETIQVVRTGDQFDGLDIIYSGLPNHLGFNDLGQVSHVSRLSDNSEVLRIWTPDLQWRTGTDGNWEDRLNWTLSIQPDHVHDVYLNTDTNVRVEGPSSDVSLRSLQLGAGNAVTTLHLLADGSLELSDGLEIGENGILTGNGEIAGAVTSGGTIRPGSSAGELEISDLFLEENSVLEIELGGLSTGEFDRLIVSGDLLLDGQIEVDLINGFTLAPGMEFDVITVGGFQSGQFEGIGEGDLVSVYNGMGLYGSYNDGFSLFTQSIPEPVSACIPPLLAVALLIRCRRRADGRA